MKNKIFNQIIGDKELLYSLLFYLAGLIIGSFSFRLFNSDAVMNMLKSIYTDNNNNLLNLFICSFSLYISVFAVTVLLGLCLIGYPIINVIPLIMGVLISIKVTYFYCSFSVKGIGYALLMIIPQSAAIVTVLIYTIRISSKLSKYILNCASHKENDNKIEVKILLRQYLLYALAVAVTVFVNSLIVYLISGLIKL